MKTYCISQEERDYLISNLPDNILKAFIKQNHIWKERFLHVHLEDELANEIRDWAMEHLLVVGLGRPKDNPDDYEFTSEGIIIDNLINTLFTG